MLTVHCCHQQQNASSYASQPRQEMRWSRSNSRGSLFQTNLSALFADSKKRECPAVLVQLQRSLPPYRACKMRFYFDRKSENCDGIELQSKKLLRQTGLQAHEVLKNGFAMSRMLGDPFDVNQILVQFFFVAHRYIRTVNIAARPITLILSTTFDLGDFSCNVSTCHGFKCLASNCRSI
jgi:hypothetical protein